MLTPELKKIKAALEAKGYTKRSSAQDHLLAELDEVDKISESELTESYRMKASAPYMGPTPGTCPTCGAAW